MSETTNAPDLSAFELSDTATMEVLTKKGEPMLWDGQQVTIEFYGPGSDRAGKWDAKLAREQQNRAMQMARGKQQDVDPHKEMADRLVFMTKQINNLPATPAQLFGNRKMLHVAEQSQRFLADNANF